MLARAARRKLRRDAFRSPTQAAEQLTLSRLRPTHIRWAASVSSISANTSDARRPRRDSFSPRHETRSLATSADIQPSYMPHGSFESIWGNRKVPSLANLEHWDPSTPLILRESTSLPTSPIRFGVGGDPIELYQNLHACLKVGRMDRALAILQRLSTIYNPSAAEVVEAHNAYLRTLLETAQHKPTAEAMAEIEEWYSTHMVRKAIEPNANTFITLLRASMTLLQGFSREAALGKYLAMVEDCDAALMDAINDSDEFDDEEWNVLIRAQPSRFKEPPATDEITQASISTPAGHDHLVKHGILPGPVLKVKEIEQKGQGLNALKQALAGFDATSEIPYPHELEGTQEEKDRAYAFMRQTKLERDAMDAAVSRWKQQDEKLKEMGIHGALKTKPLQALMWQWYSALLPQVKKEFARTKEVLSAPSKDNQTDPRHIYGPYLEACTPEKATALAVCRVLQSCAKGPRDDTRQMKVAALATRIGADLASEINTDAIHKHVAHLKKQRKRARRALLDSLALNPRGADSTPQSQAQGSTNLNGFVKTEIPLVIKARIGGMLLEHLLQAATITVTAEDPRTGQQLTSTQSAFRHQTGYAKGKKTGWIVPHPEVMKKLTNEPLFAISNSLLPMVSEPKPWTSFDDGAYYSTKIGVVRTKLGDTSQRAYAQSAIANGDMDKVLEGLDVLGRVPWQINGDVFQVMLQAWNTGEKIGGMVSSTHDYGRPVELPEDASGTERRAWSKKVKEYENLQSGLHSQRCHQNFQLEIARAYLKEKKIYFPHSVDFRGRAYPIPPLLNHIGADLSRSLLRFANGKELGSVGLSWLKVHLANLYGFDKASLRDREQFAMDNIHDVYDSATNPLTGRRWWTKAEDPWQCLACCIELRNALDSPEPTRFVSHFPVHQDGTCNGLQHYAALGGDEAGANQVNLEPSDRPQDIYTGVAELVKAMVVEDADKGHAIGNFVKDKISRKVVKRTVMTNVYGVTFMGAKMQVLDELKDIFPNFEPTEGVRDLPQVALYIAGKIFAALKKIFNGAQEIQYWLGECGARITSSISADQIKKIQELVEGREPRYEGQYKSQKRLTANAIKKLAQDAETLKTSIIWTTPLKMPVVQPYRKEGTQVVKTALQEITVLKCSPTNPVDKRKQLQAFPPNFIHSLDASHMLLSALKCSEMGLDFAAVHDSFWTHAADIPTLSVILRDAFMRMHSEDIIGRLAAEFKARYAGSMCKVHILASSELGKQINAWRKQHLGSLGSGISFKNATFEEVALEAKRQELLGSEDAELRKQGEEMVTPTSIWLANPDLTASASHRARVKPSEDGKLSKVQGKSVAVEAEAIMEELEAFDDVAADMENVEKLEAEDDVDMEAGTKNQWFMAVWVPLTFPPLPKKGSWDISRLRESKYFFS